MTQRTAHVEHSDTISGSGHGRGLDDVVLLAGPSVGILEIMREQSGQVIPEAERASSCFVPDVHHTFKVVPPGVTGPAAFGLAGETDARVTRAIDVWIRETVVAGRS